MANPCDCNVCRHNPRSGTIFDLNTGQSSNVTLSHVDIQKVIDAMTNLPVAASNVTWTTWTLPSSGTITGAGGSGGSGRLVYSMEYPGGTPPDVEEYWTPETITGWRNWRLAGHGLTVLLGMNNTFWRKPTMTAAHRGASTIPHPAPAWGCNCGINAVKELDTLLVHNGLATQTSHTIYGTVEMSGIVHEYELGYRAEKATVSELFLIGREGRTLDQARWDTIAETLRKHYRCPVRLTITHGEMDSDIVKEHIRQLQMQGVTR